MNRRLAALTAAAAACAVPPLHAQDAGLGPSGVPDAPLVIARSWLPVASVTMAFPASARTQREDLLARASDRALLAAIREATAGEPARITYDRDATGRYFVATAAPGALESVLDAMRRVSQSVLPPRLVDDAVSAMRGDLAFRGDLPRSQFDRVLDAQLRGEDGAHAGDGVAEAAELEGLATEIAATAPADRWGPPAWVLVDDGESIPSGEPPELPSLVAAGSAAGPSPPLRTQVPSDAVTRWVGSVFRFPPATTLVEASFVRLLLEESLANHQDPALFEFDTEIDARGRLVVRLSTSAGASVGWEARLDDAIVQLGSEGGVIRLDQLLPPVRSRWSRELAAAPGAGRAAAEALLRGATELQAVAFANSAGNPPAAERLRAVARGMTLVIRVVYGSN